MGNPAVSILLKNSDSSSPSHQLSTALQLGVDILSHSPLCWNFQLSWSCEGLVRITIATVGSCMQQPQRVQRTAFHSHSSPISSSYNLSSIIHLHFWLAQTYRSSQYPSLPPLIVSLPVVFPVLSYCNDLLSPFRRFNLNFKIIVFQATSLCTLHFV